VIRIRNSLDSDPTWRVLTDPDLTWRAISDPDWNSQVVPDPVHSLQHFDELFEFKIRMYMKNHFYAEFELSLFKGSQKRDERGVRNNLKGSV